MGTPKAGVFAAGQAAVAADRIGAVIRGTAQSGEYGGRGICYLEFGGHQVATVDVTFLSGQAPRGDMEGPSEAIAVDKVEFGSSRILRWFGRTWSTAAVAAGSEDRPAPGPDGSVPRRTSQCWL